LSDEIKEVRGVCDMYGIEEKFMEDFDGEALRDH
jgi:hypothetical protein